MSTRETVGIAELEEIFANRAEQFGRPEQPEKKRRRWPRRLVIALAIVLVLALAASGAVVWLYQSLVGEVTVLSPEEAFPTEDLRPDVSVASAAATNILLLGTDSRSGLGDGEILTQDSSTGQRSDTMLLLHVSADKSDVSLISLMRDSWVPIPGHGEAKLNAAMSWGGAPLAVATVEQLLGIRVDHIAIIDFEGFADVSSALGGVPVDSPVAFTSKNMRGYSFTVGENVVEGEQALAFVRERYSFPDSDFQRVKNQRSFMLGAASRLFATAGDLDVTRLARVLQVASPHLAVDSGLDVAGMVELANGFTGVSEESLAEFTLPTRGTGTSADGQSIVLLDDERIAALREALAADSVGAFAAAESSAG